MTRTTKTCAAQFTSVQLDARNLTAHSSSPQNLDHDYHEDDEIAGRRLGDSNTCNPSEKI